MNKCEGHVHGHANELRLHEKKCLPIEFNHGSEELHESSCCV
jgi:hypothetical protein